MIRRLVHFVLLGAALFVLDRREPMRLAEPRETDRAIVIDTAQIATIRERWRDATGSSPDEATLRSLVAAAADEEVLFREALRAGLDRGDAVVWRRLVDNLRFVGAANARDEIELHREARRLGMERSDAVVRKRLVERMTELLRARARGDAPTNEEIATWLATHGGRARDRVRLEHVFFSRARRGERALADARAGGPRDGDPFLHGYAFAAATERELERMLGPQVAHAAFAAAPGDWAGPIESAYGAHWIRVSERLAGESRSRAHAAAAIRREREDEVLRENIAHLRSLYVITSPPWGKVAGEAGGRGGDAR